MEVGEVPDEGDTTPFSREDVIMTIYDGCPSPGMRHTSNPRIGTPARCEWGCENTRM
jgi:hypothetical protein